MDGHQSTFIGSSIPIVYKALAFDDHRTICHLVGYIVTHRRPKGTSRIRATAPMFLKACKLSGKGF